MAFDLLKLSFRLAHTTLLSLTSLNSVYLKNIDVVSMILALVLSRLSFLLL